MIATTSRYYNFPVCSYALPDGSTIAYLQRRLLPPLDAAVPLAEHEVHSGERLDNVTAVYLGDPEQFWQICDANPVLQPEELMIAARRLVIPLPQRG